jgi:uncharacterized protein DUF5678
MDTIELSPDLREQVELAAQLESRTIQEIVDSALVEYLRAHQRDVIARETAAFERMHAELLSSHRGQWVAIHDGQLVDCDADLHSVHARVRQRYGRTPVLLTQVLDEPIQVLHWRTPSTGRRID